MKMTPIPYSGWMIKAESYQARAQPCKLTLTFVSDRVAALIRNWTGERAWRSRGDFFVFTSTYSYVCPAFLYADPGSGALILQLLAAAFFGLLFYVRFFVRRTRNLFSKKQPGEDNSDNTSTSEAERSKTSSDATAK